MNFIADQSSQSIVASSNIPLFGTANYIVYSNTLAPYSTCNVSSNISSNITSNIGSNLFLLKTGDTLSGTISGTGNLNLTGLGSSITASNLTSSFNLTVNSNITTSNLTATSIFYNGTQLSSTLSTYVTSSVLNSCNYLTAASLGSSYLQTSGGQLSGNLGIGTLAASQNQLSIYTSNSTASNQLLITSISNSASIQLNNNITSNAIIGLGCSNITGNYQNNLFLETNNSIIFNTGGINATSSTPKMIITSNGNIGLGTTNPLRKLHVSGISYLVSSFGGGAPSTSSIGSDGLSIMIYPGATTSESMGMGYANSQLWYNVPTTNYHNFYVAGTSVLQINSSGSTITGTLNATTIQENGTVLTAKYLQLSGGTMTGAVTYNTSTGNNQISITSTSTSANNSIYLKNNSTYNAYIGIAGTAFGGNYQNNLFFESTNNGIVFNTGGRTSASIPSLFISSTGNVGINTSNATQLLQIGNAGALRIANDTTDYTLLGTLDTDGTTNTRIVVSGNTRSGYAGNIELYATSGNLIFYTNNAEIARFSNVGSLGIGTNSPTSLLHLHKSTTATDIKIQLTDGTTGVASANGCAIIKTGATEDMWVQNYQNANLQFTTAGSNIISYTLGTERTRLDYRGYLGIGTNAPAQRLHVNGVIKASDFSGAYSSVSLQPGTFWMGFVEFFNPSGTRGGYVGWGGNLTNYIDLATENGYLGYRTTANLIVTSQLGIGNGTASAISGTNVLTVNGTSYFTGNVGIKTTSAATSLDVNGVINANNALGTAVPSNTGIYGGTGDRIIFYPGVAGGAYPYSIGINSYVMWYSVPSSASHIFYIGGTTAVATISSSGLSVSGITATSLTLNTNDILSVRNITSSGIINTTSNIGIGITNPSNPLSIYNSTSTASSSNQILVTSTSNYANVQFNNGITSNANIGLGCSNITGNYSNNMFLETNNAIVFNSGGINATSSTPKMIITSNGNIGLGTTNPYTIFHMKGSNPILTITGQSGSGAISQIDLATYDTLGTTNKSPCSLIAIGDGNYGASFQINQTAQGAYQTTQFTSFYISSTGKIGIGTTTNLNNLLNVNGTTYLNSNVGIGTTNSVFSLDIYNSNSANVCKIQSGTTNGYLTLSGGLSGSLGYITFFSSNNVQCGYIGWGSNLLNYFDLVSQNGYLGYRTSCNLIVTSQLGVGNGTAAAISGTNALTVTGTSYLNGNVGIGLTNPSTPLQVVGTLNATIIQENGVNLTTKYQTNVSATSTIANTNTRPYPPTYLTSSNTTITNSAYGNGTYIATAGSTYPGIGQEFFQCIGSNPSQYPGVAQWTSASGTINTSGNYTGSSSTLINGSAVIGETATIQLPYNVVVNSYSLTANGNTPYNTASPNTWYFCGSIDGTNYTQLDYRSGVTYPVNTGSFTTSNFTFTNTVGYNYYRFVVKSTSSTSYASIICDGMTLFGYEARNGALIGTVGIGTTSLAYNSSLEVYGGYTYLSSSVGIGTSPNSNASLSVLGSTFLNSNVGIGTTTANNLLSVYNSTSTASSSNQILVTSTSNYANVQFNNGITSNANIGLGCSNITGNYSNNMFLETNNAIVFNSGGVNATSSTPKMIITSNGNIGIGTNNPTSPLTIIGNTTTSSLNVNGILTIATNNWITSSDTVLRIYFQNNDVTYFQSPNGYSFRNTAGVAFLLINSSGNVGINTTNPNTGLEIYHATNPKIFLNQNSNVRSFLSGNANGLDLGNDLGTGIIRFMPNNVEKIRIDSSGNLCIGTTTASTLLTVSGQITANGLLLGTNDIGTVRNITSTGNITTSGNLSVTNSGVLSLSTGVWHTTSDGIQRFYFNSNGATYFRSYNQGAEGWFFNNSTNTTVLTVKDSGNIGIGTSGATTQNQLYIYTSASTSSNQILVTSTSNYANVQFNNGITSNANIGLGCSNIIGNYSNNMFLETNNAIVFNTGGINATSSTPKMIITLNGNIGIGTTNPTSNILQIGNAGRLKIGSGTTDYTIIGTLDTDNNTTNTKIFLNGNTCTYAGAQGSIQYFATSTGSHVFYNGTSEVARINSIGNITCSNLNMGSTGDIQTVRNITSTGLITTTNNITATGSGSTITTSNLTANFNLTVNSNITTSNLIITSDIQTVRNITSTGLISTSSNISITNSGSTSLIFDTNQNINKIQLYGANNGYSIGVGMSILSYSVPLGTTHVFYVNNVSMLTISNTGITCSNLNLGSSADIQTVRNITSTGLITTSGNITTTGTGTITSAGSIIASNLILNLTDIQSVKNIFSTGLITTTSNIIITNSASSSLIFDNNLNGTKIQFYGSSGGYSFGMNTNTLRYDVPSGSTHVFNVNNNAILTIANTGITANNLSLGPFGDILSVRNISSSGFITTSSNIIITNTTSSSLIFDSATNNTKIQLYGSSGGYSFGIDASGVILRYDVPLNASHNFYVNGSSIATINSSGLLLGLKDIGTVRNIVSTGLITTTSNVGIGTSTNLNNNLLSLYNATSTVNSSNQILVTSTSNYANVQFNNGITSNANIGLGCSNITGNYSNNMFLETNNAIVFNSGGINATSSTPKMIILSNGNIGIGTTSPQTPLDVRGTIYIKGSTGTGAPSIGIYGGAGDRLILWNGDATTNPPFSLGINNSVMWYCVPSGSSHIFYVGQATQIATITSSGITSSNSITITNTATNSLIFDNALNNTKIQLYGSANGYSFGINTNTLRYDVPLNGNHIFYVNSTSVATISSSGLSVSGITATSLTLNATDILSVRNITSSGAITTSSNIGIGTAASATAYNCLRLYTSAANSVDQLLITGTSTTGMANIRISNGGTNDSYIGLGGSAYSGTNYVGNLFIQSPTALVFNTNNNSGSSLPSMIITSTCNVGIGTLTPATRLDVSGKINVSNGVALPSTGITGGNGDRIILYPGTGVAGAASAQYPYAIGVNTTTYSSYWFSCPSNVNYIWYTSNVSNMVLDTTGTLNVWNDVIGFNNASDFNLKTNIKPLNVDCIDLINKIKPVEFNWKDIDRIPTEKRNKLDYGFIAQDIEKLLPHLVKDLTSHKIIKYDKFAPYLVKAIQEINEKIDKLMPDIEPNIYSICKCSKNIIKLLKKDILKLYINCFIEIINNEKTNKYQVMDINLTENIIKIDKDLEGNKCFIYGIHNDKFETFDKYNHLNITEKLYSIINKQQEQIDELINLYKNKFDNE